jgi:hypothetical protein
MKKPITITWKITTASHRCVGHYDRKVNSCPPEKRMQERGFMLVLAGTSQPACNPETFPVPGPRALGVRYAPAESVPSPLTTRLSRKEFAGI